MTGTQKSHSRMRPLAVLLAALLAAGGLAGCLGGDPADSPGGGNGEQGGGENGSGQQDEEIVVAAPPGWLGEEMRAAMMEYVLENEMGHTVQVQDTVHAGAIYASLGSGDVHLFPGAWLPIQKEHLESQEEGSIERIGHALPPGGVTLGVAVPKYVHDQGITSLADLDENAEMFDSTITGVEPGFGMMIEGKKRMDQGYYGLDDWELTEGSTAGMLSAYDDAVRNNEPIVVLTWTPHYMHVKWTGENQMVYLDDPGTEVDGETRTLYKEDSEDSTVETLAPSSLRENHPDVATFGENFQVPVEDENQLMLKVDEGADPREVAVQYVKDNPELVQSWLEGVN